MTYAGSLKGQMIHLYANGVEQAYLTTTNGTGTLASDAAQIFTSGCDTVATVNNCYNGLIDELRVTNTVQDADQIEASYNSSNDTMNSFGSEQSGSYNPEGQWSYRRKITFNNVPSTSNLTNFPVRVSLDNSRIKYSVMQDRGQDIRFVDSDDSTQLSYEIESWVKNGKSELWVKIPQIDSGTRTDYIWMYYGNGYAADGQEVTSVWDSSYRGVWHMKETTGIATDSTSNNNNGTYNNGAAYEPAGKIGNAASFDGSNDNIDTGSDASLDNLTGQGGGGMTVSAWMYKTRHPANNTYGLIATKGTSFSAGGWNLRTFRTNPGSNAYEFFEALTTTGHTIGSISNASGAAVQSNYLDKEWSYVTATGIGNSLGTTLNMYIDGKAGQAWLQRSNGSGTALDDSANSLLFGCDPPSTGNRCHAGLLDEIRVSNVVRSADWINAEYRSTNDAMATYGQEQLNTSGPLGSWYDSCYAYRRKITFNNAVSSSDLQNFPVRVSLDSGNVDYASTQNSGQDIRFTDSDGVKLLSHQIEVWDESGTSEVWVRVPQIDAGSTTDFIWMYYGCGSASDGQQPAGVWGANYRGVWHMNGTSGSESDSSSYAGNGTVTGSPTRGATGQIGKAYDFPGTNGNYVNVGDPVDGHLDFFEASFSYGAWVKIDAATGDNQMFVTKGGIGATESGYSILGSTTAVISGKINDGATPVSSATITPSLPSGWIHVMIVVDKTNQLLHIYQNGVEIGAGTSISTVNSPDTTVDLTIGDRALNDPTDGKIDEVRVNDGIRSADWINAEYRTGNNAMNTIGAQETVPVTSSTDAWCNDTSGVSCTSEWGSRRAVRILNGESSEDLTDFPILIRLDSNSIDYSKTQNSGQDIRFVDPANPNVVLPYQIERWDESGSSSVWVKVPQVDKSSNSDYLLMYYNNPTAPDGQDATNVWTNGYNIVYHMNEPSGSLVDSAGSTQNATRNGGVTQATGLIGYGQDFNGSTGYTNTPSPGLPKGSATYELWVQRGTGTDNTMFMVSDGAAGANSEARLYANTTVTDWAAHQRTIATQWPLTNTRWVHFTASRVGINMFIYEDGKLVGYNTAVDDFDWTANCDLLLGTDADSNCTGTLANYLDGIMDEFRISSIGRSSAWVYANYLSGSDAMTTFDSEESGSMTAPTLTAFSGGTSTTPTFQLRGYDPNSPSYLRYKIEVCSNSDCSAILRTIDQTASQTGWSGQDAQTSTAYVAGSTVAGSTLASHTYQAPPLSAGTTYYWRGYSIDPSGDNTWSPPSAIQSFTTAGSPTVPTLEQPIGGASAPKQPVFRMRSTDPNQDYLRYKIDVCADSGCSSIVRTIDQTSSQTGWISQNSQSGTAYSSDGSILNLSAQAVHVYQTPTLTPGTTYWWRAYAIDPGGSNAWTSASSIGSFTVNPDNTRLTGGTRITGGTNINQ